MERSQLDEVVHRVNNLLGTIEIQAEVARGDGSAAAFADALRVIVESARRTRTDLARITGRPVAGGAPPGADG